MTLNLQICPSCGSANVAKARNPIGPTKCLDCGLSASHAEWAHRCSLRDQPPASSTAEREAIDMEDLCNDALDALRALSSAMANDGCPCGEDAVLRAYLSVKEAMTIYAATAAERDA